MTTKCYGASKIIGHNKDAKTVNIDNEGNISQKLRESSKATMPNPLGRIKRDVWTSNVVSSTKSLSDVKKLGLEFHHAMYSEDLINPCVKAGCPENGIVFDPFMGSGTTAIVALKNKCYYTGTELNEEYIKIINKRIETVDIDVINGNNTLKELLGI
jgi:DNA modification methylase